MCSIQSKSPSIPQHWPSEHRISQKKRDKEKTQCSATRDGWHGKQEHIWIWTYCSSVVKDLPFHQQGPLFPKKKKAIDHISFSPTHTHTTVHRNAHYKREKRRTGGDGHKGIPIKLLEWESGRVRMECLQDEQHPTNKRLSYCSAKKTR